MTCSNPDAIGIHPLNASIHFLSKTEIPCSFMVKELKINACHCCMFNTHITQYFSTNVVWECQLQTWKGCTRFVVRKDFKWYYYKHCQHELEC